MAQYAIKRGLEDGRPRRRTRCSSTSRTSCRPSTSASRQLGGKVVDRESYATGANNVSTAVSRLNSHKAAVYVTSTAFGELPAFVSGFRSLRQQHTDPQLLGR